MHFLVVSKVALPKLENKTMYQPFFGHIILNNHALFWKSIISLSTIDVIRPHLIINDFRLVLSRVSVMNIYNK